jgi:O-antigen ligase
VVEPFGSTFQRWLLVALLPLMAIVFWSGSSDPVNVTKTTVAMTAALALAVSGAIRVALRRRIGLDAVLLVALLLGLALVVATLFSDVPGLSVAGTFGRSDGLLLYLSCLTLLCIGTGAFAAGPARPVLYGLLAGGAFAAAYGLLQKAGIDPVDWANIGLSPVIGTFGNPDFESAYLGIVIPGAAWGVLTTTWGRPWRIASGALLLAAAGTAVLTSAVQGPVAAVSGLAVVAAAVLLERGGEWGRRGVAVLVGVVAVAALVAAVGIAAGVGPGSRLEAIGSLKARRWYWSAAVEMWRRHPWTGVGLDRYGAYYRSARPAAAAAATNYSDAAHSVPLHLLATGGLLVLLPYLALVLLVAGLLVAGLRRHDGERRLLLAGLGGAWVAYEVQSLVSIDQPGLAVTGWVLAGSVAGVAGVPVLREWRLPGAVDPAPTKGRKGVPVVTPAAQWSGTAYAVTAVVVVAAVLGFWQAVKPLRAAHASRSGAISLVAGKGNDAFAAMNTATRLAPYEQSYWLQRGRFLEQVQQPSLALASFRRGLAEDPRSYDLAVAMARLATAQSDDALREQAEGVLRRVDRSGRWQQAVSG